MTAIIITSIIVFGVVSIVIASLVFASKFKCKHEWSDGQVLNRDLFDDFGHKQQRLYMLCRCKKCGCYRPFRTIPE